MKFLENGKTVFAKGYIFNEVDRFPRIHETYTNSFGAEKIITDFYNVAPHCYRVVLNGKEMIDVYFKV